MNRSKQLLPLLATSLSLLALPVFAQNSGSAGSSSAQPSTTRSDRDQRPSPDTSRPGGASSTSGASTDSSRSGNSDLNSRSSGQSQSNVLFSQLDSDRDGRISQLEYTQSSLLNQGSVSGKGSAGSATARSNSSTSASGAGQGAKNTTETFAKLDTNHDGYLSQDELHAGQANRMRGSLQPQKP